MVSPINLLRQKVAKRMEFQFYLTDEKGNLRFTREGKEHLMPLFALADINISNIHTMDDYLQARKQALPYFMQHLANRADTWPDTDQYRLLKMAILGDENDLQREIQYFDIKKRLKPIE